MISHANQLKFGPPKIVACLTFVVSYTAMSRKPYHISETQREILAEAQLDADLSIATVAKRSRLREFTVRRNLNLLQRDGIIDKLWYLNPFTNGYLLYNVSLEIATQFLPKLEKLIAFLLDQNEVELVKELTGRYLLCVGIRCRHPQDIADFVDRIRRTFPGSIMSKDVTNILSLTDIPIFRSARPSKRRTQLAFEQRSELGTLDTLDERILSLMRSDPDVSLTNLSRSLGIPATTATYRIKNLKESGAIVGARFFIDMFRLGHLFAIHRVVVSGDTTSALNALEERLQSIPGVYYTLRCLGSWDLMFGTITQDMQELTQCTSVVAATIGRDILRMETVHVKRFYKLNGTTYKIGPA